MTVFARFVYAAGGGMIDPIVSPSSRAVGLTLTCFAILSCGESLEVQAVDTPGVAQITVTPASATLVALDATAQFAAQAVDTEGNAVPGVTLDWSSSADDAATVNGSGLVTAADNGVATITASAGVVSGAGVVTVRQQVAAVAVTPDAATLGTLGETIQFTAQAGDAKEHPIPNASFVWRSSDRDVATIDDQGRATGTGRGTATITATAEGVVGSAALEVTPPLVRERLDVPYGTSSNRQRFDLFLPASGDGPFPLVVWVHGGGWISGSKNLADGAVQRRLLDRGYALAAVGYRLSFEATFPAQIHDVKAAVSALRAAAKEYGLDPGRFGVWGASAGGHLAAFLGTSAGVAALEPPVSANASSAVQAVVDWFGPTDMLKLDEQADARGCPAFGHNDPDSPESRFMGFPITDDPDSVQTANPARYVTADDPPFLIQHGTADCLVALEQSLILYDALVDAVGGTNVAFDSLIGAGHDGPAFRGATNFERLVSFFDAQLRSR